MTNTRTELWSFRPCKRTTLRKARNEKLLNLPYKAYNLDLKLVSTLNVRTRLQNLFLFAQENDRLRKLYTDSLNKYSDKIESRSSCQRLKEEQKRVRHEFFQKENEYRRTIESLKRAHVERIQDLESQIRKYQTEEAVNKATINQLRQDLAVHKKQIEALRKNLGQVSADVDSRYHYEIQDLKDCLLVEQEEKNELIKKLQDMEKELFISRTNMVEYQQDLTSSQHMHTLKQKIMKLRKENEILKRQILERSSN